jgi:hypothetical protein
MRDVFGIAVAVVIAGLSQIIQPWSPWWWAGMAVAGLVATYSAGHLIWGRWRTSHPKPTDNKMDPTAADFGYSGALAAAAISAVAAFWRAPRIAMVAAILAWVGIGIDYWLGPPRVFIWAKPQEAVFQGTPLGWTLSAIYPL